MKEESITEAARRDATGELERYRERALAALREGRFDLAEELLSSGTLEASSLAENLRVYQAELEIQNEELRDSQEAGAEALEGFAALFSNAPIALLVISGHGLVIDANPAATQLFALRNLRAHHHSLLRLVDERHRNALHGLVKTLTTGESEPQERSGLRFTTTEGVEFFGNLHGARLPNTRNGEPRMVCAVIDLTETVRQRLQLERTNDQLAASQEAYHVLAEYSLDWDYWLGPDGRMIHVSPGCRAVSGYGAGAFMDDAELMLRLLHPEDRPRWQAHLDAIASVNSDVTCDSMLLRLQHRDGSWRWIEHACRPVTADDGRYLGQRAVNRDVTDRQQADLKRQESERRYRALFESAAEPMLLMQHSRVTEVNQAALAMLGYDRQDAIIGWRTEQFSPKLQPSGCASDAESARLLAQARDKTISFEWVHERADRTPLLVEVTLVPIKVDTEPATFVHWRDRTAEAKARQREMQASTVFENTDEAIMMIDPEHRITVINQAFTRITGYSEVEVVGRDPSMLSAGHSNEEMIQTLSHAIEHARSWRGEIWHRRKDGEIFPARMTASPVTDDSGQVTGFIGIFSDISEAKRSEEELYRLAHNDALTGLPNRTLLRARMEQSLQRAQRDARVLALLFIDLDLFKVVNDSLGHSVGDELLKRVAEVIQGQVRAADTIARLGGDEFVILMDSLDEPATAAHLAQRLCELIAQEYQIADQKLRVTASIGISLFPDDGETMETLLSNADMAMYRAKDEGRNTYRFFEAAMSTQAFQRLRLETALRGALQNDEMRLVFQPQFNLHDNLMHGAETLLRWTHPELGAVAPAAFIVVAEEIGLVNELGRWVLDQACRQLRAWDERGFIIPRLGVNVSIQQLERADFMDEIKTLFEATRVEPDRLEIEVTESVLMRNAERVTANLRALRDLGVTLAVDDFGSGFSSLGYLQQLPISRLKIDKSFVDGVTVNDDDDTLARAIIALSKTLGLYTVAEGVETEAQAEFLRREGCDEMQGYLKGRPMEAEALRQAFDAGR